MSIKRNDKKNRRKGENESLKWSKYRKLGGLKKREKRKEKREKRKEKSNKCLKKNNIEVEE